jgi:transmembrane sensor
MNLQPSPPVDHGDDAAPVVTPEIAAEAAVWIARLHGPDRSIHMERECLAWQGRSAAHRRAFERCTDTWEDVTRVTLGDAYATVSAQGSDPSGSGEPVRSTRRPRWSLALAAGACLSVGVFLGQLWLDRGVHSTGVGEQQLVVLDDGTRMSLNTDTLVRVDIGPSLRSVTVRGGEALFEVAKDAHRPFVVHAADSEVVALGTVFSVRLASNDAHAADALDVTLIEGQVTVRPAPANRTGGVSPASAQLMQPGQRMRLVKATGPSSAAATAQIDRPRLEEVTAWKRNEAIFDDVPLAQAVAEMNRYDRTPIAVVGDGALALRVSGLYRTGDSAGFARAVAVLHGLVVRERGGRLELESPQ